MKDDFNFDTRWDGQSGSYVYRSDSQQSSYKQPRRSKGLPWWVMLIGFSINWVIGLALVGYHLYLRGGYQYEPRTTEKSVNEKVSYIDVAYREPGTKRQSEAHNGPERLRNKAQGLMDKVHTSSWILLVVGLALMFIGILTTADTLSFSIYYDTLREFLGIYLEDLVIGGMFTLGGIGALFEGTRRRKGVKQGLRLVVIVGDKPIMSVKDIASAAGMPLSKCRKQLQRCVDQGLFGENAYLDFGSDMLITGKATAQERQAAQMPAQEAEAPTVENAQKAESQYQAIINQLQALDNAIPGEEMSQKIRRLSQVSQKIFKLVEENPEKLPQLRRFMDYYLPTAMKLLTSYSQLDAQGVDGANITEAKNKIESAMDSLVTAFENQLDKLFAADALDISSDISAMENMLKMDGLTKGADF